MGRKRWWSWHDKKNNHINKWGRGRRRWWSWHDSPKKRASAVRKNYSPINGFLRTIKGIVRIFAAPFIVARVSKKNVVTNTRISNNVSTKAKVNSSKISKAKTMSFNKQSTTQPKSTNINNQNTLNSEILSSTNIQDSSKPLPRTYGEFIKHWEESDELSEFEKSIGFGSAKVCDNQEVCNNCGKPFVDCKCDNKNPLPFENQAPGYFSGFSDDFF